MDVCRNAVPHVGTCVVVQSSWNNDTLIFRTREAPWNQRVSFCAKLVIFAQAGQTDMADVMTFVRPPAARSFAQQRRRVNVTDRMFHKPASTCSPFQGSSSRFLSAYRKSQ